MKITSTYVTNIILDKQEIYKTICDSFADQIADSREEPDIMEACASDFVRILGKFHKGELKHIFNEGYTMVLLPGKAFEEVEKFFGLLRRNPSLELNITIMDNNKPFEVINHDYLSY